MKQSVCVIGLGYMGLPMAALLAEAGHSVLGVDINPDTVARVNRGECPFSEPGMADLVRQAHASGRLKAALKPEPAEAFVLALPTPVDHVTHAADMHFVEAGIASVAPVLKAGDLVVLESTSPVGTTEKLMAPLLTRLRPDLQGQVGLVFCPERAIPGNTLHEMVHNDRLVGGTTPEATAKGVELYQTFCKGAVLPTQAGTAEMVKLVENASRDVQIAFANELSLACAQLGLDVRQVIALANRHPRVNILQPGTGVGGHCIAVDPWFIIDSAPDVTPLLRVARQVNDGKPAWVARHVRECVERIKAESGQTDPVRVACLGLAYKPDVDDLRESPSLTVADALKGYQDIEISVVEPHLLPGQGAGLRLAGLEEATQAAQVVVLLTAHMVFQLVNSTLRPGAWVVDPTGLWASAAKPGPVPGVVWQI